MGLTNFPNGLTSFGSVVNGIDAPPAGREFYVRQTSDTGYEAWKNDMQHTVRGGGNSVHTTIESALAAAADWDTIWVWPGFYEPAADLEITQKGLRLLAVQTGPLLAMSSTMIYACGTAACDPVINIKASNVEVAGFRIYPYLSGTAVGIFIAPTVSAYGSWIHDNIFYVVPEGLSGLMPTNIWVGNAAFAASYTLIEDNYFFCGGNFTAETGMIQVETATRSVIRRNHFNIISNQTTQAAIKIATGSGALTSPKQRIWILDNLFFGAELDVNAMVCYGVLFADTVYAGDCMADGNKSVNIAAPFSSLYTTMLGLNYINGVAIVATGTA